MDLLDLLPFLREQPEFIQQVVIALAPFLAAAVLIIVLRWLMTILMLRPLRRLVSRTSSEVDDRLLEASVSPLRLAAVGIALILATIIIAFDATVADIAVTIGRALLICAVFFAGARWFEALSLRPEAFARITGWTIPERLLPFLNTLVKFLIIALGAIFVLQELHFDVAALIASLGVVGIGISLASQNTVSNMFGFAAIVSDDPFKVGDFIRTPALSGIVESVGVRSTRVRQLDQALLTVPNNQLTDAVVLNFSRIEKRRLDVTLTFTYSTSAEQMRQAVAEIRELLKGTEDIDPDSVIVHFVDFAESSLNLRIIAQVMFADFREFMALKERLYLEFMGIVERLGIEFAFPSQSVYIESTPASHAPEAPLEQQLEELRARTDEASRGTPGTAQP